MSPAAERRLLQIAIAVGGLVPVGAGLHGMISGAAMMPHASAVDLSLDSHVRYLSGLLFGIGIAFWAAIPDIEVRTRRARLLTAIVVVGGLARTAGLARGIPSEPMILAIGMELLVTPLLCLWQSRIARLYHTPE